MKTYVSYPGVFSHYVIANIWEGICLVTLVQIAGARRMDAAAEINHMQYGKEARAALSHDPAPGSITNPDRRYAAGTGSSALAETKKHLNQHHEHDVQHHAHEPSSERLKDTNMSEAMMDADRTQNGTQNGLHGALDADGTPEKKGLVINVKTNNDGNPELTGASGGSVDGTSKSSGMIELNVWWILIGCSIFIIFFIFVCLGRSSLSNGLTEVRHRHISKDQTRIIYEWTQTPEKITVFTKPPHGISKQLLDVTIRPNFITIGRKGRPPFMKEELFSNINAEASTWDITREGELAVTLPKKEKAEWPCVMLAHFKRGSKETVNSASDQSPPSSSAESS